MLFVRKFKMCGIISLWLVLPGAILRADEPADPSSPISFLKDVAPILVQNCIACHNPRKSESKYVMTTFAQLAKGGQQGEGIMFEAGDPDASYFVELIRARWRTPGCPINRTHSPPSHLP